MSLVQLVEDPEWGNYYVLSSAGYLVIVLLMIAILLLASFLVKADQRAKIGTKRLVFSAMALALGTLLSMVKLFSLPMGGTVTPCSMLFVTLIGYWYGLSMGITASIAYGMLQLILDPYIISLPQMLVDYIFAFGALGLSGLFCNAKHGLVKGYIAAVIGRFFFAWLSGVIFFGSNASYYNMAVPLYSLLYNGSYLVTEAAITLVILAIPAVHKAMLRVKQVAVSEEQRTQHAGGLQ